MAQDFTGGLFANFVLSMMLKKITVPGDFHAQTDAVKGFLKNDVTGLADSLTDFAVEAANVKFGVECDNTELTKKLNSWLNNINSDYKGKIPRGINALAKEYFKERWKSSSFPVLKILKWGEVDGLAVPTQMCIIDGGSVYSKIINKNESKKSLLGYEYYLGQDTSAKGEKLDKGVIITKPFARWFDEYPTPFLIKRGVYNNYKIIQSLKDKQTQILDQIIPYMLLIKRGTEKLAVEGTKVYSQPELDKIRQDLQDFMDEMRNTNTSTSQVKSPVRTTQFDEEMNHLIPDLTNLFKRDIFLVAERNMLAGLGFIDLVEATSSNRTETILNPKVFIEDVKSGVRDFKNQIVSELVAQILETNRGAHRKYTVVNCRVTNSPVVGFMTEKFKDLIRQLYDRGRISSQTAVEIIAEVEFETEVKRRESETKDGIEEKMYPVVTRNDEAKGIDNPKKKTPETDENGKTIPEEKRDPTEKEKYNNSTEEEIQDILDLTGAPYTNIKSLPDSVKKLPVSKQRIWMKTFNSAYAYYLGKTGNKKEAESKAFGTAWSQVNKNSKKGK